MSIKKSVLISVIAVFAALSIAPVANATSSNNRKVGICHATGSRTNPYVFIRVDKHAVAAHERHQDGRDVIGVESKADCPRAIVAANAQTNEGEDKHVDENEEALATKDVPAEIPATGPGAALAAVAGMSALAYTSTAYIRSRRGL